MRAEALTPADIFGYHVRYVVPLFQRPYVWNQQDQWEPLWDDIRAVAERLLHVLPLLGGPANGPLSALVTPHFLGAIVVEQAPTLVGAIQVYHVIDGQQRLTTLQLLLDAAGRVTEKYGDAEDARRLRQLVVNDPAVRRDDEACKVWPTLGDRDAYLTVMTGAKSGHGGGLGQPEVGGTPVTEAHGFFSEAIRAWAHEDNAAGATAVRLRALARAIGGYLRAVVIHLDPGDNAQGIFETLNHRGAPLLAADLIKNLVFRVAQAEGLDVVPLYQKYWADLDGPYWRAYVKRGRQVVPRIDVFVNYWLVMRLVREVRADQIFTSFRDHLGEAGAHIEELLRELAGDARHYEAIGAASSSQQPYPSTTDMFSYRVFGALDAGAVTPFYLWLMHWPVSRLPVAQRDRALAAVESWVLRRWLCGLSTKDYSNTVLELVRALDSAGPQRAGEVTEAFLYEQRSGSRLWPDDEQVRKALKSTALDPPGVRPRLRMLIEAIEDRRRADLGEGAACERDLTVEHVMPLAWRSNWAPGGVDAATAMLRDTLIHTLGNLTLVRWKLSPALASLPWTDAQAAAEGLGRTGKRTELTSHSRLTINADLVASDSWTEATIAARTAELAETILQVWPKPTQAPGQAPAQSSASPAVPASVAMASPRVATIGSDRSYGYRAERDSRGAYRRQDDDDISAIFTKDHDYTVHSDEDALGRGTEIADDDTGSDEEDPFDVDSVDDDGLDEGAADDSQAHESQAHESQADDGPAGDAIDGLDGESLGGGGGPAEAAASRFARLAQFLAAQSADTVPMTFEQLEDVMEDPLPPSARTSIPYWSSTNAALGRAIVAGGFKPTNVDLWNERVIFARDAQGRRPRRPRQHPRRRNPGRQGGLDR